MFWFREVRSILAVVEKEKSALTGSRCDFGDWKGCHWYVILSLGVDAGKRWEGMACGCDLGLGLRKGGDDKAGERLMSLRTASSTGLLLKTIGLKISATNLRRSEVRNQCTQS